MPTEMYDLIHKQAGGNISRQEAEQLKAMLTRARALTIDRFDDLLPLGISIGPASSAPSFTAYNGGNLRAYEYSNTVLKALLMGWQLAHSWKVASPIYPHLHLFIPAGVTGVIKFGMSYTWCNIDDVEGAETVITGTLTVSSGATNNGNAILKLDSAMINPAGKTISSLLDAYIYRGPTDAEDTFAGSVWLKSVDFHYQKDSNGSPQEYRK